MHAHAHEKPKPRPPVSEAAAAGALRPAVGAPQLFPHIRAGERAVIGDDARHHEEYGAMEMTGGQALARQLVAEGVTDVFGIPGVQLDWATDALLDVAGELRYVTPRHEQATSYMADGYARSTGREGVCMVVPGPGLLNAMSGLATAYACHSPVLCIAGQIPSAHIGRGLGMLHEVRGQSAILGSVTKWQALARRPEEIPALVHEAFVQLRSGPTRPVGLEIPPDVLAAKAEVQLLPRARPQAAPAADEAALQSLAAALRAARFPVVWAGGGVSASRTGESLQRLAEALQAPVVMTDNGRGALSSRHALATTALGGRCLLPHADFVLVLGSRFVDGQGRPMHLLCPCLLLLHPCLLLLICLHLLLQLLA